MLKPCTLVIAEKPSLARDIANAIPGKRVTKSGYIEIDEGEVIVTWCFGHMLENLTPDEIDEKWKRWSFATLPITPFPLLLRPIPSSKSQLLTIKSLCAKATTIVNAGDAGREGELLVREVLEYSKATKVPLKRLWLQATTKEAVQKAWANLQPGSKYDGLFAAGQGRQLGDFWVGMSLSRAWSLAGKGADGSNEAISIGRVQTPTMALVVARDLEIEGFRSKDFYEVEGAFNHAAVKFTAKWQPSKGVRLDDEDRLLDKGLAEGIARKVKGKPAKVLVSEAKPRKESAPLPYHLAAMQAIASARYGFTAARTLELMQKLYEEHKALTYPRGECRYLADSQFSEAPTVLAAIAKTAPHLASLVANADPRLRHEAFDDKKLGEHHATIPTTQASNYSAFSDEEKKIYDLAALSYIALFYPDNTYNALVLEVECEAELFRVTGKAPTFAGWKAVYGKGFALDEDDEDAPQMLPNLSVGAVASCHDARLLTKRTKPPARMTDGTLLGAMESIHRFVTDERLKTVLRENQGLGTAATRAATLERLVSVGYLKRQGKFLVSTEKARNICKVLPKALTEPGLTALFEQELQKIVEGSSTLERFLELQRKFVADQVGLARAADRKFVLTPPKGPVYKCPNCASGALRHIFNQAKGWDFWGCSDFNEGCKTSFNNDGGKPDVERKTKSTWSAATASNPAKPSAARPAAARPAAKK